MLKKYTTLVLFVSILLMASNVMAQLPPGPCGGSGQPPCVPSTPIDGGVGLLLVLGVGYAVSKLRKDKE